MSAGAEVDREALAGLVALALTEDLGAGDITTDATVPAEARGRARIIQKQPGVVFGLDAAREAFLQCGADGLDALMIEGQWREAVPAELALATYGTPSEVILRLQALSDAPATVRVRCAFPVVEAWLAGVTEQTGQPLDPAALEVQLPGNGVVTLRLAVEPGAAQPLPVEKESTP